MGVSEVFFGGSACALSWAFFFSSLRACMLSSAQYALLETLLACSFHLQQHEERTSISKKFSGIP